MNRRVMILLGLLLGASLLAVGQTARPPVDPADDLPGMVEPEPPAELAVIYDGEETLAPGFALGDWGFIPRLSKDNPYQPVRMGRRSYAISVVSMGRYQGMRVDFTTPLESEQLIGVKGAYLEVLFRDDNRFAASQPTTGTPTAGGPGATPPAVMPPAGPPPGMPGQPGMGRMDVEDEGMPPTAKATLVPAPKLDSLRVTLCTEKGTVVLVVPKSDFFPMTEVNRQWLRIGIPLFGVKAPFGGKLTRIIITTEKPASFLIGRLAIVQDTAPIQVQTFIYPAFLQAGRRISYIARVKSGLARFETTWNFDTGAEKPALVKGERVTHIFDKEGTYTITCTVRDVLDAKPPVTRDVRQKVTAAPE